MHRTVFDGQKTAVASLADNKVMPCGAFAKARRFGKVAGHPSGKTKGATPPRQRAYVYYWGFCGVGRAASITRAIKQK